MFIDSNTTVFKETKYGICFDICNFNYGRAFGGAFVYISDFFEGVIVRFFRFISKQIPYLVSLNSLVLESIKLSCGN